MLHGIKSENLPIVWEDVKPFIEEALTLDDGRWTIESIYKSIQEKDRQLWVSLDMGVKAVGITEIINYPGKKVCNIFLGSGDMNYMVPHMNEIKAWAKSQGCTTIEIHGREGWQRIFGWKRAGVILRQEI